MRAQVLELLVLGVSAIAVLALGCSDDQVGMPYGAVTEVREVGDGRLLVAGYSAPCQCDAVNGFVEFLDESESLQEFSSRLRAGKVPATRTLPPVWGAVECSGTEVIGVTGRQNPPVVVRGPKWRTEELPEEWVLVSIDGSECDDLLAVGRKGEAQSSDQIGVIVRFDGESWQEMATPAGTPPLARVWSGDAGSFAVGDEGTILTLDESVWVRMDTPTELNLRGVWGAGERVYAVGGDAAEQYVILELAGGIWLPVAEGEGILLSVRGRSEDDVYAVGGRALANGDVACTAVHFDGDAWEPLECNLLVSLWEVWPLENGRVIVGGEDSTLVEIRD